MILPPDQRRQECQRGSGQPEQTLSEVRPPDVGDSAVDGDRQKKTEECLEEATGALVALTSLE